MAISFDTDYCNGTPMRNGNYTLGKGIQVINSSANVIIFDNDKTEGWLFKEITDGQIEIKNSTKTGCSITVSGTEEDDTDAYFNGTFTVKY